MDLINALKKYGLTDNQAKVYLACLEVGSGPVQKISRIAGLPRTTCYQVLESLRPLGLISSFQKKKVSYFSAEDPKKMVREAVERAETLTKTLPKFSALYNEATARPTLRVYQGRIAMKGVLDEITREAKEILVLDAFSAALGKDFDTYIKKRVQNKIRTKVIMRDSELARRPQNTWEAELREVRIIEPSFEYRNIIFIWNDKVAMLSSEKDFVAYVVEDKSLAEFHRTSFNYIWGTLA